MDIVHNDLYDLGARVSVMSFPVSNSLQLHDYVPTVVTLKMADKSMKQPVGV
jgi:hypothetical protein